MGVPQPMLSSPARGWPPGEWVLQAKWDGYRLLIEVGRDGRPRAWSRHGTSLTQALGDLLEPFAGVASSTVLDGELVALARSDGRVVQDFAAIGRGVFGRDSEAVAALPFVAFDVLEHAGENMRLRGWRDRDALLGEIAPVGGRVRVVTTRPAASDDHEAIVGLGFEGTVLKRPGSVYRSGRSSAWRKLKARHALEGELVKSIVDRDGMRRAVCDIDGRRIIAAATPNLTHRPGEPVAIIYSRVDADGSLREARAMPIADRRVPLPVQLPQGAGPIHH